MQPKDGRGRFLAVRISSNQARYRWASSNARHHSLTSADAHFGCIHVAQVYFAWRSYVRAWYTSHAGGSAGLGSRNDTGFGAAIMLQQRTPGQHPAGCSRCSCIEMFFLSARRCRSRAAQEVCAQVQSLTRLRFSQHQLHQAQSLHRARDHIMWMQVGMRCSMAEWHLFDGQCFLKLLKACACTTC